MYGRITAKKMIALQAPIIYDAAVRQEDINGDLLISHS